MIERTSVSAPWRTVRRAGLRDPLGVTTRRESVRFVIGVVLIAGADYALAKAMSPLVLTGGLYAVWPTFGFGVAVLYLAGLRWWPGVLLGEVVVRSYAAIGLGGGLVVAAVNAASVVVAVIILRQLIGPRARLDRLAHVGAVLVAVGIGEAISGTGGTSVRVIEGLLDPAQIAGFWRGWWLNAVVGGVVIVPLALAWSGPLAAAWRGHGAWEGALMLASVAGLSAIVSSASHPLLYLVWPAFLWAALRFGPQGATAAAAIAAVTGVWFTANELGPFVEHSATGTVVNLQLYIGFSALTAQCLAAVVSEQRSAALELAESRARLNQTSDRERRKLEHDLHDGAQQHLIGALIRTSTVEERVIDDPDLRRSVSGIRVELESAIEELRALARGIYPAVLAQEGLAVALRSLALGSPASIAVHAAGPRIAPEIEAAFYFCCVEAVQNAVKHGGPDVEVSIRLWNSPDELQLEVRDTGPGFAVATRGGGLGLESMRDRVASIGGRVEILSKPGQGTIVVAIAPLNNPLGHLNSNERDTARPG